ncbi:MAG: hypothetical protein KAG45_07120, partial [Methyloprofundus sp.]|nr:hypothetical protein [Methyloprofundus sp.]
MSQYTVTEHVDLGTIALSRGDYGKAQTHFLTAARDLLAQAKLNQGELRQRQLDQANKLWKQAQQLDAAIKPDLNNDKRTALSDDSRASLPQTDLSLDDVAGLDSV